MSVYVVAALWVGAVGPAGFPFAEVLHTARGRAGGDRFGVVVAAVGDVNADGTADWAVGAPRAGGETDFRGEVRVFSGASGAELLRLEGDSAFDAFGSAVAAAGDVDLDGHADLLVGAPRGTPAAGSAELRSGRDGSLLLRLVGRAAGDRFGQALAGVGDLDGDGRPELAVGAPGSDAGGSSAGELTVFSGADGEPLWRVTGGSWDQLGRAVCAAGDVDGDGSPDLAVGVPFSDAGAFNGGAVYVLSGRNGGRLRSMLGEGIGDQLGFALAGGTDADLDGVPDLLCVAPGAENASLIDAGAAELRSGADGRVLTRVYGREDAAYLAAADFLGDLDGDGRPELLVGAASAGTAQQGRVRVVSGADGSELAEHVGLRSRDWFGASVAALGDLDGDGRPDFAVGAPGHEDDPQLVGYLRVLAAPAPRSPRSGH